MSKMLYRLCLFSSHSFWYYNDLQMGPFRLLLHTSLPTVRHMNRWSLSHLRLLSPAMQRRFGDGACHDLVVPQYIDVTMMTMTIHREECLQTQYQSV